MTTPPGAASQGGAFAHVRAGSCDIAVPVGAIVRAIGMPAGGLTALPRRRGALAGLVTLDGSAVPVVALDRWIALGAPGDPADARIVILRAGPARIGIQVDALLGMRQVEAAAIRQVHHAADSDELFDAVAPPTASQPLLCVLDVRRLMALANTWCDEAGLPAAAQNAAVGEQRAPHVRHALFQIGDALWAVPASAITRVARTPVPELHWAGQLTCGICPWDGRKLPLVDLAHAGDAGADKARPWMAVVADGPLSIGIVVTRCDRFLDLAAEQVHPAAGQPLLAGTAAIAGLGTVSVLGVGRLFAAVPEASISHRPPVPRSQAAAPAAVADRYANYLVFEAGGHYASPAAGMVGVVALQPDTIDDLVAGRQATLAWRGQTLGVVNLPSIDGTQTSASPRLAVVLQGQPGTGQPCSAIAIRSLTDWLPAHAARRSGMRMNAVGDISMITSQRLHGGASLVVVDLAQMAYLLH